jgi:hypothetical protein
LWWTKWRWDRFSPSASVSPANFSTITLTYHPGLVQQASSGRSTQSPTAQFILKKKIPSAKCIPPQTERERKKGTKTHNVSFAVTFKLFYIILTGTNVAF